MRTPYKKIVGYILAVALAGGGVVIWQTNPGNSPLASCASIEYESPGLSGGDAPDANTITFTLDQEYGCGQFANGDWFVMPEAPGGTVTVTAISPASTGSGSTFRNGQAVNWAVTTGNNQPWDGRLAGLVAGSALPLTVGGGSSIIKYASNDPAVATCGDPTTPDCAEFMAVLTVLDTAPASPLTTFRPPHFGTHKPLISTTLLDTTLLDSLASTSLKIPASQAFDRTRHIRYQTSPSSVDSGAGGIEPREAYPPDGDTWGAEVARDDAEVISWLMSDQACRDTATPVCTAEENLNAKIPVLIGFVQYGIDIWGAIRGGATLYKGGGGQGVGIGLQMAFAAAFLSDYPDIQTDLTNSDASDFWETNSFVKNAATGNIAVWGQPVTEVQYWNNLDTTGPGGHRDPYGYIDGGGMPGTSYQRSTAPPAKYIGFIFHMTPEIAAAMPGSSADNIKEYVDRWVASGTHTVPDPCAPKTGTYGVDYGPNGSGGCITGSSRVPQNHGLNADCGKPNWATGCRHSNYVEEMWDTYRSTFP